MTNPHTDELVERVALAVKTALLTCPTIEPDAYAYQLTDDEHAFIARAALTSLDVPGQLQDTGVPASPSGHSPEVEP